MVGRARSFGSTHSKMHRGWLGAETHFLLPCDNACQLALDGSDPRKQFQWGKEVKEFTNTLETVGSTSAVNILRGPGPKREKNKPYKFSWDNVNFPLPSKYARGNFNQWS